jgi:hypothetical protein
VIVVLAEEDLDLYSHLQEAELFKGLKPFQRGRLPAHKIHQNILSKGVYAHVLERIKAVLLL